MVTETHRGPTGAARWAGLGKGSGSPSPLLCVLETCDPVSASQGSSPTGRVFILTSSPVPTPPLHSGCARADEQGFQPEAPPEGDPPRPNGPVSRHRDRGAGAGGDDISALSPFGERPMCVNIFEGRGLGDVGSQGIDPSGH